jgi:hypothetical protein
MVSDDERDRFRLARFTALRLPGRKPADAPDVILNLDRVDAVAEYLNAYVVTVDEDVETAVVLFLSWKGCSDVRCTSAHHAAAKSTGYGLQGREHRHGLGAPTAREASWRLRKQPSSSPSGVTA